MAARAKKTKAAGGTPKTAQSFAEKFLLEYQREAADALLVRRKRFFFGLWARQTGKSHFGAFAAAALCWLQPGYRHVITAPSERQSLAHLEKCKRWHRAMSLAVEDEVTEYAEPGNAESMILSKSIRLSNGSSIYAVPGRPDTVRGFSGGVTLDEFDFFEDQESVWRALIPTISNPLGGFFKPLIILTTPNGAGRMAQALWNAHAAEKRGAWACSKTDIYRAAAAMKKERGIDMNLDELRGLVSPDAWAQEFECRFVDGSAVMFPYALIGKCESAECSAAIDRARLDAAERQFFVGVDVGRRHDLTVVFVLEKLGDVFWTRGCIEMRAAEFSAQFAAISDVLAHRSVVRCAVDATGLGMQLAEELQKRFGSWRVQACTVSAAFKTLVFTRLRAMMEDRLVRLPAARELREDLRSVQKRVSASGAVRYVAARTEDGHADRAFALALALEAADDGAGGVCARPVDVVGAGLSRSKYAAWH